MIDVKTGSLIFDKEIVIHQNSDFDSVHKMSLGEIQEVDIMGNEDIWLRNKNILVAGLYFNISFLFNNLRLKELSFIVSDKKFALEPKWEYWSEEKEIESLKLYQDWLTMEVGSQRVFDWGEVWIDYDRKGGSSSIGLRYNER